MKATARIILPPIALSGIALVILATFAMTQPAVGRASSASSLALSKFTTPTSVLTLTTTPTLTPTPTPPCVHGWQVYEGPMPGTSRGLNAVSVLSSTLAWAVGSYDTSTTTSNSLVVRWNGTQWTHVPSPNPTFSDVPTSNAFYAHIETVYKHNVISGYADGTFRPGNDVTRGQLCKVVYLAVIE